MSNINNRTNDAGGSTSRFGGVAKEGADMLKRAFSVAAREEIDSARQETIQKLAPVAQSTGMMIGGGVLAAYGATYVLQAVVQLLSTWMPRWLASLLTGTALLAGAGVLVQRGRSQIKSPDESSPGDDQQH